jgi:hypothetical protein
VLVDQFEEFFTNPENYHRGAPSRDSNLVLNVLLETARIALEEDLPIYIVFTMRSDYIGQCAAFRGLPEYIGFSQFFVPRLNRSQLQQVIEEPAVLSGNRITRRLTERLIHDLTEGVDQLPILQHALNQVWHAANNGNEEMDLIHYAMVGGMPVNELPDEHVERFRNWFQGLPEEIKACYHEPDLQNVLDTHTNKLFEQAAEYYTAKTGKQISDEDAKSIVKTAFTCLTKIDQSRAVRNRMTLTEITNIIGNKKFSSLEVGVILNIFREPGNTFVRPFITDDPDTLALRDDDILDITHESLIRNWEYLGEWAEEEFRDYTVSLDFEQQLNRWVESDKSSGFLLSIGALTYFENWYNKVKPNAYWIARYLPEDIDQRDKLSRARETLNNATEFLQRSARKHVVTRTVMRYGARRIAAVLGVIAILLLSSFAVRDYFRKQNDYVLKTIKEQTIELAGIPKLSPEFSVPVITEQLMLGNLTISEVIDGIPDLHQKIRIATAIATQLFTQGRNEPADEILESLTQADNLLEQLTPGSTNTKMSEGLKLLYDYSVTSGFARYYSSDLQLADFPKRNAARSARWALQILKEQPTGFSDIQFLSFALADGINYKAFSLSEIAELLNILSPFENANRTDWITDNYARDKVLIRGAQTYGIRYNGLYQDLAYLYAASGMPGKAVQCMDSILRYQENFYQNDYSSHIENASNVAAVFYTYGRESDLAAFVNGYCARKKITANEFYHRLVGRMFVHHGSIANINFYAGGGGQAFSNLNLQIVDDAMLGFFYKLWRDEINKVANPDERNFQLAVSLKNEGSMLFYRKEMRGVSVVPSDYDYYSRAFGHYAQVSKSYLEQPTSIIGVSGADFITVPRKYLFVYPDYRVPFHPFEPRQIIQFYNSPSFVQYVLEADLFDRIYETRNDLVGFESWLKDYQIMMGSRDWLGRDPMSYEVMQALAAKLDEYSVASTLDLNILYLHLSDNAFRNQEPDKGIEFIRKIQRGLLLNAFQYKNFTFANSYSLELTAYAIANLAVHNEFEQAYQLVRVFRKEVNRSSLYAFASQCVSLNKQSPDVAKRLLDSARTEMNRLDDPADFQPNRHNVAMALMYLDPDENADEAYRIIKNSPNKFQALFRFSKAYAFHSNLFNAQQVEPPLISTGDRTGFLALSVEGLNLSKGIPSNWKKFKENELIFSRRFLPYINE